MRILMPIILIVFMPGMAAAVPVDANAPDGIAARFVESQTGSLWYWVLCTDNNTCLARYDVGFGESVLTESNCWPSGFPFPLSEVVDWSPQRGFGDSDHLYDEIAILRSGEVWVNRGGWVAVPPLSCNGVVKSDGSAFGKLKSMFR